MTTKFLHHKICTFKIVLSWRCPSKITFWTIVLSAPSPTPSKRKLLFYCRLAVSDFCKGENLNGSGTARTGCNNHFSFLPQIPVQTSVLDSTRSCRIKRPELTIATGVRTPQTIEIFPLGPSLILVIFFFPYSPPTPPYPDKPPARPTPKSLISVHFGSVWLRFGCVRLRFGSVSGLFRAGGSVSGPFRVRFGVLYGVGVGSGRGASVREKNITILFLQERPPSLIQHVLTLLVFWSRVRLAPDSQLHPGASDCARKLALAA